MSSARHYTSPRLLGVCSGLRRYIATSWGHSTTVLKIEREGEVLDTNGVVHSRGITANQVVIRWCGSDQLSLIK